MDQKMSSWTDPVQDQTDQLMSATKTDRVLPFSWSRVYHMHVAWLRSLGRIWDVKQCQSLIAMAGIFIRNRIQVRVLTCSLELDRWISDAGKRSVYTRRTNFLRSRLPGAPWLWRFQAK